MYVSDGDTVQTQKVFEIRRVENRALIGQSQPPTEHLSLLRELPDVPVLSETLLLVELACSDRPVELRRISKIILSDPGATIQVLRLAGRECAEGSRSGRIEDCIAGLGLGACLDAMSRRTVTRTSQYAPIVEAWEHARSIAEISRQLVEDMAWNAVPEDATLVGLCHEIGRFPELLGWDFPLPHARGIDFAGQTIAAEWSFPVCVREYFAGRINAGSHRRWSAIVDRAHEIAKDRAAAAGEIEEFRWIRILPENADGLKKGKFHSAVPIGHSQIAFR